MAVHELTDKAALTELVEANPGKLVVVDFFATWCGPCKQIGPFVPQFATEFPDCVFVKVDVDEADDLSEVSSKLITNKNLIEMQFKGVQRDGDADVHIPPRWRKGRRVHGNGRRTNSKHHSQANRVTKLQVTNPVFKFMF